MTTDPLQALRDAGWTVDVAVEAFEDESGSHPTVYFATKGDSTNLDPLAEPPPDFVSVYVTADQVPALLGQAQPK